MSIKSNKVFNIAAVIFLFNVLISYYYAYATFPFARIAFYVNAVIFLCVCALSVALKIKEYIKSENTERSLINLAADIFAIVGFVFLALRSMKYANIASRWVKAISGFVGIATIVLFSISAVLFIAFMLKKKISLKAIAKIKYWLTPNKALNIGVFFAIFNVYIKSTYLGEYISAIAACLVGLFFMVIAIKLTAKNISPKNENRLPVLKGVSFIVFITGIIAITSTSFFILIAEAFWFSSIAIIILTISMPLFYFMMFVSIPLFATALIFKTIELSKKRKVKVS